MRPNYQFDRYAESVIGGRPQDFDAIEVHGVRVDPASSGEESIVRDNERPEFFSVYLHYKEGNETGGEGVQCAGDFTRRLDAQVYAAELREKYSWPMHDYSTEPNPMRAWEKMNDNALLDAVKLQDIDDAAKHVQDIAGITTGDVASEALERHRKTWPYMRLSSRLLALEEWRELEERRDCDYATGVPRQLETTLILAGLRLLQERRHQLSEGIVDILAEDNILVDTADQQAQLAEDIDAVCERVNSSTPDLEIITIVKDLLPYARSRAEDLHATAQNDNLPSADWELANAAVEAGYKLIGEKP